MAYLIKGGKGQLYSSWTVLKWAMEKLGLYITIQVFQPLVPLAVRVQSHVTHSMAVKAMDSSHKRRKEGRTFLYIGQGKDLARRASLAKGSTTL